MTRSEHARFLNRDAARQGKKGVAGFRANVDRHIAACVGADGTMGKEELAEAAKRITGFVRGDVQCKGKGMDRSDGGSVGAQVGIRGEGMTFNVCKMVAGENRLLCQTNNLGDAINQALYLFAESAESRQYMYNIYEPGDCPSRPRWTTHPEFFK